MRSVDGVYGRIRALDVWRAYECANNRDGEGEPTRRSTWGSNSAFGYDGNGNLKGDGTNTYVWDARNQLSSISGGTTATFQYDPFGRRVSKTILATTTSFLYDGANSIQELSGGTPKANLLTGGVDEIFARTDTNGSWNFLADGIGSTSALTQANGTIATQYSYDPFGNTSTSGLTSTNPSQYTGRENDGTGVYFYRNRYYSPTLQRFVSEDPIGIAGGINLYEYAGNSPTNLRDPNGLCADPGGSGTRYCIDTYIPQQSVWGFTGDNRGPDPNGGTYRTQQTVVMNPDGSINESDDVGTSQFGPFTRRGSQDGCGATSLAGRKNNGPRGFHANCWASDGLGFGFAPDAGYSLTLVETPNGVYLSGLGTSFPSLEIWQYGGPNGPTLIYNYNAQSAGTGPSNLLGPLIPIGPK